MFHVLQCIIYDYNLDEYYEKIVSTYETINLDEYLISSQIEYGTMYSHHSYLCDIILRDKEYKNFSKEYDNIFDDLYPDKKYYPFDTKERFFGFLPFLYNTKRLDLFYRLLDVLYDLIINFGSKSTTLIKDLYNYSKILNEDRFTDGLKNALRQLLKNSIKCNDFDFDNTIDSYIGKSNLADIIIFNNEIYKFIDLDTIHFDKEKELAFVRRIYSTLYIKYGDIIRKLELISNTIDYYKVSIFILDEWKNSINEYFINLLKDIDKNIDFDTNFIDMNKHSTYYVNYLKSVKIPFYDVWWRIINYLLETPEIIVKHFNVIDNTIKVLCNKTKFKSIYFNKGLINYIMPKYGEGSLEKYYNSRMDLFDLYKKLIVSIRGHYYPDKEYYDFQERVVE